MKLWKRNEQMFLHLDYKAHNLMYADGRVRLIVPLKLLITQESFYGKGGGKLPKYNLFNERKNMKLRYSEAFYSVQGEGRFVGVPIVFLRTFGCNRCLNFGLDRGESMRDVKNENGIIRTQEVQDLIDNNVHKDTKEFNDLPHYTYRL